MNPPPPTLPAAGSVTASAKPVATAASTAFPPRRMISTPAALASALLLATMPLGATVAVRPAPTFHPAGMRAAAAAAAGEGVALPPVPRQATQARTAAVAMNAVLLMVITEL